MMAGRRFITGMAFLAVAVLLLGMLAACQSKYTEADSEKIARDFVQNEATFRFDGMLDTLKLTDATRLGAGSWEFTYRYNSRAAGYGDRTGQILAQVITPHEARVTVTDNKVTKGVLDGKWDMLTQQLVGTPPPPKPSYSVFELEYLLFAEFPNIFYVDPDFYPVARPGSELGNAAAQFTTIRANAEEFAAILEQLGLPDKSDYTDDEKLSIYREHKKLTRGAQMTASGNDYGFVLLIGEGQGEKITGTITRAGKITITSREPSYNTYPICLAKGTLIDTPDGPVPVEQIRKGLAVWSLDESGRRVAVFVAETIATPVPPSFQVVTVILSDGRTVTASWGHPTAENKALGSYPAGDTLDGARVTGVVSAAYDGGATYDILPSGTTGLYWANGVLLASTIKG